MNIRIHGVNAEKCHTNVADYVITFYPRDHNRHEVRKEIRRNNHTVTHTETAEGGELLSWYIEPRN